MLSGKPVIASMDAEADATHMILEAKAGFVTKADDVEMFANSFKQMAVASTDSLQVMGDNSRKFAECKLSKKANLSLVVNEIKKIID